MSRARPIHIFVLIDALGWRFLDGRDFLSDVLPYRKPLRTVLGFSSGAIPTILTGVPPARHGHWNLFYYDPDGSPFHWLAHFRSLPNCVLDNRVTRKLIKELGRKLLGMGRNFECCVSPNLMPWFNYVERRNIYEPGGISGASSIFDELAQNGIRSRVYTYQQWTDKEILHRAEEDLKARAATFYFLYLSEMDHLLNDQWNQPEEPARRLGWYATQLRKLFGLGCETSPEAHFTVFSDHGMTPVRHRYDLVRDLQTLGLKIPDDYLVVYDSTMARFWFFSERGRREIVHLLQAIPCGKILPDEELHQLGILFPDRRYGEVIYLLHPGWLVSRSDFNGPGWIPAGMHGYHPDDPYSDAVFLSSHEPPVPVRALADVFYCMQAAVREESSARDAEPAVPRQEGS